MHYVIQLMPHANIRYMDSLKKLATNELVCMLSALNINATPTLETYGGAPFLVFESVPLSQSALRQLSTLSCMYMLFEMADGLFKPISPSFPWYFDRDLAEVLKYKGKTNASFTMLMLNCALSASAFFNETEPLTIFDPLCGKGTTLFCALRRGDNAIGIELDKKAVKETSDYFTKYLQLYRFKHKKRLSSVTLPKGKNAPQTTFTFLNDLARAENQEPLQLSLFLGDTIDSPSMVKPLSAHLIICDLPYGVQHAPQGAVRGKGFLPLLQSALPQWKKALKKGGAIALSFNTFTIEKAAIIKALTIAGFTVLSNGPYADFDHYVEQAVNRDIVIAVHS